jgi:6-phosphofructokinase 1
LKEATVKCIGVLSSGGDAPGMNPNLRAVVRAGLYHGLRVVGIERGYNGLLTNCVRDLSSRDVSGIINRGGTFLRTARCKPFFQPEGRAQAMETIRRHGIDGLVVCGGDGSFRGALALHQEYGLPVAGTPGTIDNDIAGTDYTIGFDTAVGTAVEACDKIRDTADSHDRIFVVEVMGRRSGWIALVTAVTSGAEVVLLPERPQFGVEQCIECLQEACAKGKTSMLVIVAEGAGRGTEVASAIEKALGGARARAIVLGHLLRGGTPSSNDRLLATRTGEDAVKALLELGNDCCHHIGVVANRVVRTPLEAVLATPKAIDDELLELVDVMASLSPRAVRAG